MPNNIDNASKRPGKAIETDTVAPFLPSFDTSDTQKQPQIDVLAEEQVVSTSIEAKKGPWQWFRILGQVGELYVIIETNDGIVLMDPHAAHERVLYEGFMGRLLSGKHAQRQRLLVPEVVELPPVDALRVRKNLELLDQMGFGISEFGADSFMLESLPSCLGNVSGATILLDIAAMVDSIGKHGAIEKWNTEMVAQSACKTAVKSRDKLSMTEVKKLLSDLVDTEMPYTCPHGRPTLVFIGYDELKRKFKRK